MMFKFTHYGASVTVPGKYEVCGTCNGAGSRVNPAVDGNGITGSEMAEMDSDDRESYFSGVYDVTCSECNGDRVVVEADEAMCSAAQLEMLDEAAQDAYDARREADSERGVDGAYIC